MDATNRSNQQYQKVFRPSLAWVLPVLALLVAAAVVASAGSGFVEIAWTDVARIVAGAMTGARGLAAHVDDLALAVVMDVRLPRILTAVLVGAGLSVSGAVFQGILLNPLADPYTLGVSAGAAFGASLCLLLNFTLLGFWSVPASAFAGAASTLVAVIYLTTGRSDFSSGSLILAGIIVAAVLSAGVSLIKFLADEEVGIIVFWLMGSFASKTWAETALAGVCLALGTSVALFFARELNLMALGDRMAGSLGVASRRISLILLVTASLVTAVCVAVSGIIGFVGLLVPHMARFVTGPDNRRLIPVSALAGGLLLLCADSLTRAVLPREVPIGVITALIGGPFFCYLFRRHQLHQDR
jgi:iron complex transport system permease protein